MDLHYYGTEVYDMWKSWMGLDVATEMNKYAGVQAGRQARVEVGVLW